MTDRLALVALCEEHSHHPHDRATALELLIRVSPLDGDGFDALRAASIEAAATASLRPPTLSTAGTVEGSARLRLAVPRSDGAETSAAQGLDVRMRLSRALHAAGEVLRDHGYEPERIGYVG